MFIGSFLLHDLMRRSLVLVSPFHVYFRSVRYPNCQFAEHLYRLRGVFCWKTQGFQGEGGDATTSGGIMAG